MLDNTTKRRIDTARDILVGKIPDPKSQVEQITIALVYKFMDDMDAEAEELGGDRKFFADGFSQYGWVKLIRSGLGGHEILNLYAEAITRMSENPGIPLLFRNIFKNAYLPYRDPETLRAFLKIIDEFTYDHSERLGDAFEYLLSVLGSQGDAGQFRTPRHIIDFIVSIVDPGKDEVILDPACGTAGFLISAYKHIKSKNVDNKGNLILTPDDKGKMVKNFKGYDISPDMIRLSLVNMYLHGFSDPHIHEYDTLTSQDRWNEYADVILANPPFMSPKGGIRPHNRFSVQSKRSEVLFVDYIADHLTPEGRAGVIVPEGIIFQSQNAYKQLRKKLVDESLLAVISMPAGVFQPYSNVKTSILILDKELAKKADTVAFFKVENDGYSLGAQRNSINKNDLPEVLSEVEKYKDYIREGDRSVEYLTEKGLVVKRDKIAENGEYNLSGERYREVVLANSDWPLISISDICDFKSGLWKGEKEPLKTIKIFRNTNFTKDGYLNTNNVAEHPVEAKQLETRLLKYNDILLEKSGGGPKQPVGRVALLNLESGEYTFSNFTTRIRVADIKADPRFVWHCLKHLYRVGATENLQKRTSGIRNLDNQAYQKLKIPLPPLDIQKEIVAEIEGYQKVIDGARAVVGNYKPHIQIDPEWPLEPLASHFDIRSGGTPSKANNNFWKGNIPWVSPKDMKSDIIEDTEDHITEEAINNSATRLIDSGSVVCVVRSGILKHSFPVALLSKAMCINQDLIAFLPLSNTISSKFLFYYLKTKSDFILNEGIKPGVTVQSFYNGYFRDFLLAKPTHETQNAIISDIEKEQLIISKNRELISIFEKKIEDKINNIWVAKIQV